MREAAAGQFIASAFGRNKCDPPAQRTTAGRTLVPMAPSPSYQPAALRSVAMDCDPPAQRTTAGRRRYGGCFRGDGALAIVPSPPRLLGFVV